MVLRLDILQISAQSKQQRRTTVNRGYIRVFGSGKSQSGTEGNPEYNLPESLVNAVREADRNDAKLPLENS